MSSTIENMLVNLSQHINASLTNEPKKDTFKVVQLAELGGKGIKAPS